MNAIAQFNQLGGKTVSRQSLILLKELAYLEGSNEIILRIDNVLNSHPESEGNEFELEVEKPVIEIGLGAAQHSGLYREALDECGRLQKGYKFENGFVVKVQTGEVDKKKFKKVDPAVVEKPKKTASNYGKKRPFIKSAKVVPIEEKPTRTPKKPTNYGKKRDFESVKSKYTFSKDDIPYQTAYNAHSGTSFSPEKRAVQEQNEYFQHLEHVFKSNRKKAVALGKLDEFETKFERYKEGYLKRFLEHVRSKIGFFSTMIAGPANFPVRRMEKKANAINAKLNALIDYQKYADFFKPETNIIKTGSETALSKLEAKLEAAEKNHALLLAGSKALKKLRADKNATENDYKDAFINLGFDLATAKKEANYMFKYSYAGFFTTNSSAKIRTIKSQIALEKRLKAQAFIAASENPTEITFEGGSIENDYTDNRIKIFFDSIPDVEIRNFLKKAGQAFKWSPKNKAWQRQLNTYYSGSRNDLYKFLGVNEPEPTKKKVVKPKDTFYDNIPVEVLDNYPDNSRPKKNAKSANVQVLDLREITLDTKRFQNRNKLEENVVQNIVDNFDPTQFDPLILWQDKGKNYLLAGHHRYEALKRLGKKTAEVKFKKATEKEAIYFAKVESNANRTLETPIERAKIYREMRNELSKKAIEEKAKAIEGKNATTILNLSFLNPSGIVIDSLQKIAVGDEQNKSTLGTVADWIGDARRTYTDLTNSHEKEMFDFLMDKEASKRVTTKAEFKQKIYALVGTLDFDATKPLNLKRFKYVTEGEKVYQEESDELNRQIRELTEQKLNLLSRLSDPTRTDFIQKNDEAGNNAAAKKLDEYNNRITKIQKDVIELSRNKGKYTAASNQAALFGAMPEPILYVPTVVPERETILVPEVKPQPTTANKLMQMQFDSLTMDEGWQDLIQDPARNMKIAIWGKPKNGKTSAALQLASYLTKFGSVIYNFVDQGFNKSTQDLWIDSGLANKTNATPSDITSSTDLEKELKTGNYTFCFIDMISDWIRTEKMKPEEFKERFMRQFPNVSFILIFEVTKGGDFKGDQGWTHLVDAIMTVENFLIENRGRYGMGEKIVWEEGFKKFNPKGYAEFMENREPEESEEELFSEEIEKI